MLVTMNEVLSHLCKILTVIIVKTYLQTGWRRYRIARRPVVRATSHLCVKHERSLIITYSLYSENIMRYHFYVKHTRGEE